MNRVNQVSFDSTSGQGRGVYVDLSRRLDLLFDPTGAREEEGALMYRVSVKLPDGLALERGAAFFHLTKKGEPMHNVELDDPSWSGKLRLSMFPDDATGMARLVWFRPDAVPKAA